MDDLVRHCLRELSFDGDLGCDVSRLRDFISDFYSAASSSGRVEGQNVDDAFCAFVWSVIIQQLGVRVGTLPAGSSTDVYIAPQASAVKKAKAKGEDAAAEDSAPVTGLDIVEDAVIRPLEDLRKQYGESLRVAVDPETTFAALTGSHIRPSKLTPMIYTGLQIITRGRERGVSVLDLGKQSGYDQKTCFYIIKQLVDLDLVVKLRQPGVSTNIAVHKYFYERSPIWQQVAAEEKKAVSEAQAKDEDGESEEDDDEEETKPFTPVHFDPIGSRHLSSMPVLKSRLTKLLKACPHNMHTSNNLMLKIGFGFIEKVNVPHANRKRFPDKKVPCIHLLKEDGPSQGQDEVVPMEDDDVEGKFSTQLLPTNFSLHKQVIDCLAEAGTTGMTLNELSAALGNFDKRTIDLLLNRLEKDPPPAHLADLGIAQLAETHGRERRYKYYTVAHYLALAEREKFEDQRYRDADMSAVGAFLHVDADVFYEDDDELDRHVREMSTSKGSGPTAKAKGKKKYTNPTLPDGSIKRGRPRKSQGAGEDGEAMPTPSKKGKKRKREEDGGEDGAAEPPPKKKRGRPPKNPTASVASEGGPSQAAPTPKKRGRPPKKKVVDAEEQASGPPGPSSAQQESVSVFAAPKKRGRPRKIPESIMGPPDEIPVPRDSEGQENVPPVPLPIEDVPMPERRASSPLSSLPPSPAHISSIAETTRDAEEGSSHPERRADDSQPEPVSQDAYAEGPSSSLRRSARTPKTRKQIDAAPSPKRNSRRQRPSTTAAAVIEEDHVQARTMQVDEPASSQLSTKDTAQRVAQEVHSSLVLPDTTAHTDIPIDPALLGGDDLARLALAQGHSLIAMTPPPEFPHAGPSTLQKRDQPDTASETPSAKRSRAGDSNKFRSRGNISQPRRENEILRLLAEADGIVNTSTKEIYDAHAALVEKLVKAGEPTSIPIGSRIDKRTLEATLRDLESKSKVKLLTTSVPTLTGSNRMARIAYLPETSSDAVNVFLAELSQHLSSLPPIPSAANLKTLDEPIDYGRGRTKAPDRARPSQAPEQGASETRELKLDDTTTLFQQDDQVVHDVLLTEKNTVAQLYGYTVGRAARARTLHIATVALFEKDAASAQVVSKQHRIMHTSYYFTDMPISIYCSLVAVLQPDQELTALLHSPSGQDTPVGAVSDSLRAALAPAQAKSRARILSLLSLLQILGLVTPLVPAESTTPQFVCTDNGEHPAAFNVAPPGPYTPAIAPLYWRFNDAASIRLWALGDGLPPVWKTASVSTGQQVALFWSDLEKVCIDLVYTQEVLGATPAPTGPASEEIATAGKSLRRTFSWSVIYNLSFYQAEYLRRHIDSATGNTPLEDEDASRREAELDRLSWVVSASKEVVVSWFEKARKKHLRDLKKHKHSTSKGKRKANADEDASAVVSRRAAEAKEQREREWEGMVRRMHPGELRQSATQRVHRVRGKFMQSNAKASEKWEARILEAIKEADLVAEKLLSTARAPLFTPMPVAKPALPAPAPSSLQEKDVDELIASQGPRVSQDSRTGKKTRKGKERDTGETDVKAPRRHRFLWNRDYDELVRDASAIIKARCRGPTRLDWGAMEQIFPAVPRNSVRQRLVHLKEVAGTETYLSRLEDKWYDLWVQHRGTEVLPDPDPESATNFNLATHVKFLRKHIDKNAIRVGFVEVQDSQTVELPGTLEEIQEYFEVVEKTSNAPQWDFMWSVVAEEAREKQFAHRAITAEVGDMPPIPAYESDWLYVADAAVKIVLGNPKETYDADVASRLLKGVGEEPVRLTTTELLNRGVLARTLRDPTKTKPGRTLKISDNNSNSLGGQLHRELFQDASALEDLIVQQQQQQQQLDGPDAASGTAPEPWQEWPLLATDGDTAFLLELASEIKVRFDVDTSHPQSMRSIIDWNSKKADDDDIETAVRVRYVDIARPSRPRSPQEARTEASGISAGMDVDVDQPSLSLEHGKLADGKLAFCRRMSEGVIDCQACLQHARESLLRELNADERDVVDHILAALEEAGPPGLARQDICEKLGFVQENTLSSAIQRVSERPVPLAHWAGYTTIVLVASACIRKWTVTIFDSKEDEPESTSEPLQRSMIFPRRWLDIYGRKLTDMWESALRAVLGLVLLHPGVSQAEIRWRLRSAYDRQEVGEVLQTLLDARYITSRVDTAHVDQCGAFGGPLPDEREERFTFWFLADAGSESGRRWYQV
ncbi:transcription factor [Ganoderma sinense ZZ0214-1]|uniref:Transcription factor n=1 Tax=Ganoderma sinense ZZ0214-1 TaxID=1077348 RepID=A0A2G8SBJ4_9APHY|nr:transcription factor [Ganoderma sinense ZZ0214-1]